ncbi:hypothetical protein [Saccharothrix australiensis]|uniref:Uncharacterized protein n=1 Tax=Saccharothrix australiensis TaxID=2072 RepID=A0A495W236_9PSEU|nr:hypothetical protein [Saccharothrix australiensis]RKT55087.1 hypothetical protein C8E97_3743 [Saccharothrix australiensis]
MPIAFDTTGLRQQDQSTWLHPATGDVVSLQYFDLVPDLPAPLEDLPRLRHDLAVIYGEAGCLIEAHALLLGGVPALFQVLKLPLPNQPTGQVFVASFTVPRAASSAVLMAQAPERGVTGVREAVLAARVGFDKWVLPHPYAPQVKGRLPFHAGDDPRYDAEFADHPLTRVRAWAHHVIRTATVDPRFAALPPFGGPAPRQPAPPGPGSHNLGPHNPGTHAPAHQNPAHQNPAHQNPAPHGPVPPGSVPHQGIAPQPSAPHGDTAQAPATPPPAHAAPQPSAPPAHAAPAHAAPEPPPPAHAAPEAGPPAHAAPDPAGPPAEAPGHAAPPAHTTTPAAPTASDAPADAPAHAAPPPGPQVGSTLTTVVPGIPIGGYLPLWVGDECTFWRMDDPAEVLALLGLGTLARTPLAETRFRDLVALDPDSSSVVLLNRYRSADGGVAAGIAGLTRVSGQEASAGMNEDTLLEAFRWVGRVSGAAAERGECVTVEPGTHAGELEEPYVLMVVQEYEGERLSVVQTAPTPPADLPLWEGRRSMNGPATPESIATGGILAMYAMDRWGVHPLHLCLTFGPIPGLVRGR